MDQHPGDVHNLWNKTRAELRLAVFKLDLPEEGCWHEHLAYKAMLDCQVQRLRDLATPHSPAPTNRGGVRSAVSPRRAHGPNGVQVSLKAKARPAGRGGKTVTGTSELACRKSCLGRVDPYMVLGKDPRQEETLSEQYAVQLHPKQEICFYVST